MVPEDRLELSERRKHRLLDESFGSEDGIEGHRAVALRQYEPVAVGIVRIVCGHFQDPVVQHPDHIQRRLSGGGVLLVTRHERDEPVKVRISTQDWHSSAPASRLTAQASRRTWP